MLKKKLEEVEREKEQIRKEKEAAEEKLKACEKAKEANAGNTTRENDGKVADANNSNKVATKDNAVASKAKKNNSKNISNNKIPHAGAGSVVMLAIITAGAIVYTKKVISKK